MVELVQSPYSGLMVPLADNKRSWFIVNYQRKFISAQEKTTPIVQEPIDKAYTSKAKMPEDEDEQPWMQEDKEAFKAVTDLASSMTKLCKNVPLPEHVKPDPQREKQLPIYTQFKAHPLIDSITQELQKLLAVFPSVQSVRLLPRTGRTPNVRPLDETDAKL